MIHAWRRWAQRSDPVAGCNLLDHVDIAILQRRRSSRSDRVGSDGRLSVRSTIACVLGAPVVLPAVNYISSYFIYFPAKHKDSHLPIQLLLRLPLPSIGHQSATLTSSPPSTTTLPAISISPPTPPTIISPLPPNRAPRPAQPSPIPFLSILPRNVPIHPFRRRLPCIRPSRRPGATAPVSVLASVPPTTGLFNAIKEAATRVEGGVEGVSWLGGQRGGRTGWKEGKTDRLAVGICPVEFANGLAGVGDVAVGDVGCAGGAAGAVVAEGQGLNGCDAVEEVLLRRAMFA